jgi:hypothetical protein
MLPFVLAGTPREEPACLRPIEKAATETCRLLPCAPNEENASYSPGPGPERLGAALEVRSLGVRADHGARANEKETADVPVSSTQQHADTACSDLSSPALSPAVTVTLLRHSVTEQRE